MQRAWGSDNAALYALPFGTSAGPAAWAHALLPDYHSFSGRGGYAFPLYDRRHGPEATNLSPVLLENLALAYGAPASAPDVFDAILCLLSASSYTLRFADDLEDVFPHIPFPAAHSVFQRAVATGREIRLVETFARQPRPPPPSFCHLASQPAGALAAGSWRDGEITLCADGAGRVTGLPLPVWEFAVSGYRLLPRWLEGRAGLAADLALIREFRDIAARIAELILRFDEADLVLRDTLVDTLTRESLGVASRGTEVANERE